MRVGLVSSAAASPVRAQALERTGSTLERVLVLVPVLVGVALLELALSDGGQHLDTLTWVQTVSMLTFAVIVWMGAVPRGAVSWSIIGMVAAIAVSSAISVRPESSVRELLLWLMYLSFFAVTASTLSGPAAARRFVDVVVVIGGWLCLIALFLFWGADNPTMRWYSTFYWPNPFAGFLLLLLPLALVRFLYAREIRDSFAHGAISVLLTVSLVLTYSRGAWVSLFLTMPVAFAVLRLPAWGACARRMAVLAALVAAAVVLLTRGAVLEGSTRGTYGRGGSTAVLEDLSIQGRLGFWESGLRIFRDYPLLGAGAGTFGAVHPLYQRDARFYSKDAHNYYLQTAAEMGLIGVVALTAIVISAAMLWWRKLQMTRQTEEYAIVAGLGLGLAAFALHSAVDMDWRFPANPAMAFALIGVLAASGKGDPQGRFRVEPPAARWRFLVVPGLLLAVAVVQGLQHAQRHFAAGQRLAQNGQWADAADQYTEAARWDPLSAQYWAALAVASTQVKPPRDTVAVTSIRRAMAVDRMNAAHPLQFAKVIMGQGADAAHNEEAEPLLRQALRLDPYNRPEAYRVLALLFLREARPEDASQVYIDAIARYRGRNLGRGSLLYLRLWPEVTSLYIDAADFFVRRGTIPQAVEILRELLGEDPASVPAAIRLAALYVQVGRPDEARKVLEATAEHVPDSADLRAALQKLP